MKNALSLTTLKLQPMASITSNNIKYVISSFIFNQVLEIIPGDFLFQEYVQNSKKDPCGESFRITLPHHYTNYISAT